MSVQILLAPGTGSATSSNIEVDRIGVSVGLTGALLTGADTIAVQYSVDGGSNFFNLFDYAKGAQAVFNSTCSVIFLDGPMIYRFSRGAIATSTGVNAVIGSIR